MTNPNAIRTQVELPIGWLIIDRPESRGAMTSAMWAALPDALERLAGTDGVRVVVIRGTGGYFVAGADITEFEQLRSNPDLAAAYDRGAEATLRALDDLAVPSLAMIEGPCVGGGCLIAFGCDLRIASADARMGIPAGKLGLAYPPAGIGRLVAVLGEAEALALTLSGRLLSGSEAYDRGLVQYCVEPAELERSSRALCSEISSNAPLALRYLRMAIRRRNEPMLGAAAVQELADACFRSSDYREGVAAFLEKRVPRFRGR